MGNVPLMRTLSTSSINWMWCAWGSTLQISDLLLSSLRDKQQLCSNKKRSPRCLQRFRLIPADCALQHPQGTDFQTAASRSRFLRWVHPRPQTVHFSTGLVLSVQHCTSPFSVYTSVGATTNLTQVGKHWVFNRFYNALSQTIWSSCTVADHRGILHCCAFNKGHSVQWDNLSSCFFSPLKATDGKPQMHLAQQNATFTHLSCVLTVTAQVFISSC